METIKYQGEEIQAEKMGEMGGYMGSLRGRLRNGEDEIWRDEEGCYYLRRLRYVTTEKGPNFLHEAQDAGVLFDSVHRIGINAAILWAINNLSEDPLELRLDAADLIMEDRGYNDPHDAYSRYTQAKREAAGLGNRALTVVPREPAPALQEDGDGVTRFTFDYPPTEQFCGLRRTVDLTDEQMDQVRELASIFSLDLGPFLRGLVHNNTLPGQLRRSDDKVKDMLQAEHIGFVCTDDAMAKRIARAAQACGQSVDEFVADALGADVDMYEENMLLHPTSGDLLDTDFEDLYTKVGEKVTAAPIGQENDPFYMGHPGKERVNFSVYLRPDQLELVEYPHMVWSDAEDRELPCVLIPLDPEGNPYLSVGKHEMKPGEPIPHLEPLRPAKRKGAA